MFARLFRLVEDEEIDNLEKGKVKMFCIGSSKKQFLIGRNRYIKSKQFHFNYPHFASYHAEFDFYLKAKKKELSFDDIFVFGFRTSVLENTRPCIYCARLLLEIDFKRIHFFENGKVISMKKNAFVKEVLENPEKFKDFK